jgi:hypothetical protein
MGIAISLLAMSTIGLGIQSVKLQQQENKRSNVDKAIEECLRRANSVFEAIAMEEMIDTCTSYTNIVTYYSEHCRDADNYTQIYLDSIRPSFTKTEMHEITNAINTHCDEQRQAWFEKMIQKNKQNYEDPTLY